MSTTSPPSGAPPRITPARGWYALALAILLVGVVAASLLAVRAFAAFPNLGEEFRSGERQTTELADEGLTIFVADTGGAEDFSIEGQCQVAGPDNVDFTLEQPGNETVGTGGRDWKAFLRSSEPRPPGEYTIQCETDREDVVWAAGPHESITTTVFSIFGAIGSMGFSLLIALTVALLVYLKRRGNQQRWQAAAFGPSGPPPPQGPPPPGPPPGPFPASGPPPPPPAGPTPAGPPPRR